MEFIIKGFGIGVLESFSCSLAHFSFIDSWCRLVKKGELSLERLLSRGD